MKYLSDTRIPMDLRMDAANASLAFVEAKASYMRETLAYEARKRAKPGQPVEGQHFLDCHFAEADAERTLQKAIAALVAYAERNSL